MLFTKFQSHVFVSILLACSHISQAAPYRPGTTFTSSFFDNTAHDSTTAEKGLTTTGQESPTTGQGMKYLFEVGTCPNYEALVNAALPDYVERNPLIPVSRLNPAHFRYFVEGSQGRYTIVPFVLFPDYNEYHYRIRHEICQCDRAHCQYDDDITNLMMSRVKEVTFVLFGVGDYKIYKSIIDIAFHANEALNAWYSFMSTSVIDYPHIAGNKGYASTGTTLCTWIGPELEVDKCSGYTAKHIPIII